MSVQLLSRVTCPHCWTAFAPEDVLWIASHSALRGDDRLGDDALRRFLPSRFTALCEAIDACGLPCTDLACPPCYLGIPRAALPLQDARFRDKALGSGSDDSTTAGMMSRQETVLHEAVARVRRYTELGDVGSGGRLVDRRDNSAS